VNIWVIGGAVLTALMLFAVTILLLWSLRVEPDVSTPATAMLNVIYLPTSTPTVITPTPAVDTPATEPAPPSPPPGIITLGAFVQITGTGGDGLRLRSEPSLQSDVLILGLESEVFQVQEGPRSGDGYTWWFLVAPYEDTVGGWAAANFLEVVQNP
jgi:hypothetical protein